MRDTGSRFYLPQVGKVKNRDFAKMQKILEEAAAGLKKDKKKTQ